MLCNIRRVVVLLSVLCLWGLLAEAAQQFPAATGFVSDFAKVLQPANVDRLQRILRTFEEKTRIEFHITTLPALPKGMAVNATAAALYKEWKLGKQGENNGLLLLLAPNDRGLYLEAGSIFQPILSDQRSTQLLGDAMSDAVGRGEYDRAMTQGADALIRILNERLKLGLNLRQLLQK